MGEAWHGDVVVGDLLCTKMFYNGKYYLVDKEGEGCGWGDVHICLWELPWTPAAFTPYLTNFPEGIWTEQDGILLHEEYGCCACAAYSIVLAPTQSAHNAFKSVGACTRYTDEDNCSGGYSTCGECKFCCKKQDQARGGCGW